MDELAYVVGAVLLWKQNDSDMDKWSKIGYWSRTLISAKQNYFSFKREYFGAICTFTFTTSVH